MRNNIPVCAHVEVWLRSFFLNIFKLEKPHSTNGLYLHGRPKPEMQACGHLRGNRPQRHNIWQNGHGAVSLHLFWLLTTEQEEKMKREKAEAAKIQKEKKEFERQEKARKEEEAKELERQEFEHKELERQELERQQLEKRDSE